MRMLHVMQQGAKMVKAKLYLRYCREAKIYVGCTEKRVLEEMVLPYGWFDENDYLNRMVKEKFYITSNQKEILKRMPHKGDPVDIREWRKAETQRFVSKIRLRNYFGI